MELSEAELKYESQRKSVLHNQFRSNRKTIGWILGVGLLLSHYGVFTPPNLYIRCNDINISFDQQQDSISIVALILVSLLMPYSVVLLLESLNSSEDKSSSRIKKAFKISNDYLITLFVGNLFSFFIVEILKILVSEPRPHFMKTCGPNLTEEMCQQPWIHLGLDNCTNPMNLPRRVVMDSMKSFPSGHASVGIYSVVFISYYIQRKVNIDWSYVLTPFLQMSCWIWGSLCCASRVWDNRHHWWDVLVGALIGGVAAYATVIYLCNRFDKQETDGSKNVPDKSKIDRNKALI